MCSTFAGLASAIFIVARIMCCLPASAFATGDQLFVTGSRQTSTRRFFWQRHASTATSPPPSSIDIADPPSWDELQSILSKQHADDRVQTPLVTLYRDTNGWCPFCERVWVILRAKGIPYQEELINLQNKPKWFTDIVPTGLVPAVLIHDDEIAKQQLSKSSSSVDDPAPARRLIWESLDIIAELDKSFPDTPPMVHESLHNYKEATDLLTKVQSAGFTFLYGGRNSTLSESDKENNMKDFDSALDELDSFLLKDRGGPFMLGANFSAADAIAIPMLERWRYQLPLTSGVDILQDRQGITDWFNALDSFAPYKDRVAGDRYSWSAVASYFLRLFGSRDGDLSADTREAMDRADAAAKTLTDGFARKEEEEPLARLHSPEAGLAASVEAARKLITNHEAVLKDCTDPKPKTQDGLGRATDMQESITAADLVLRSVAVSLLDHDYGLGDIVITSPSPITALSGSAKDSAVKALLVVAGRLCVPRDMSAPAAGLLRCKLAELADKIEALQ